MSSPFSSPSPTSAGSLSSHDNDSLFDACWTFDENKACEVALASHLECADRWERTAACVGNKTPEEVQSYYQQLEDDLRRIDLGLVPVPEYDEFFHSCDIELMVPPIPSPPLSLGCSPQHSMEPLLPVSMLIPEPMAPPPPQKPKKSSKSSSPKKAKAPAVSSGQTEKRKGVPWTEDEHKLFLLGLSKFGKGDWRNIARTYVVTRTPTQVASHAQKYFIRLNSHNKKEKRRASIHDITSASIDGMEYSVGHDQEMC